MRTILLCILSMSLNIAISQTIDTTYSFKPCLLGKICVVKNILGTSINNQNISFRIDLSSENLIYGTLRNKKGDFIYNGSIENELLYIEVKNEKGDVVKEVRYKLKKVKPIYQLVISIQTGERENKLRGVLKNYIQDGYCRTFKNGKETSNIYHYEGKKLKMKL